MDSPLDKLESQVWLTLDSNESIEQLLAFPRTSGHTKALTTPPRSRSASTSTPPRQPRKLRYKRSSRLPAGCPAEAALQSLLESTHISDSSPKHRSQTTVKSLFSMKPSNSPFPSNHPAVKCKSMARRSTYTDGAPGIQSSFARPTFIRSHSTSQISLVSAQGGSDFSSNCASNVRCNAGSMPGRGVKRVRSKSEQGNEGIEDFSSERFVPMNGSSGRGHPPIKKFKMLCVT
ncbi:hypothetical protein E1B28_002324 [Marasmius oreades]|uniref:Uncharacterized protein n=1 Tax=Marasmius oreades TaxID=181124 RepID=A0A9P7RMM0_9AGAR|nr:uncharacterized protein E1B28_002324 [Marasmius oreades]KAG7086364.1 hypothetical protein E1B28_002324 [Marasmius oreades]